VTLEKLGVKKKRRVTYEGKVGCMRLDLRGEKSGKLNGTRGDIEIIC